MSVHVALNVHDVNIKPKTCLSKSDTFSNSRMADVAESKK